MFPWPQLPWGRPRGMAVRLGRAAGWQEARPLWPSPSPELAPWLALLFLASVPLPMCVGRGRSSRHTLLSPLEGPCHPWACTRPPSQGRAVQRAQFSAGRPPCVDRPRSPRGGSCSPHVSGQRSLPGGGGVSCAPCLSWGPHRMLLEPSASPLLPQPPRFGGLSCPRPVSPNTTAPSVQHPAWCQQASLCRTGAPPFSLLGGPTAS